MTGEPYTLEETSVRFARSPWRIGAAVVVSLALLAVGLRFGVWFFLFPLPIAVGALAKATRRARVVASSEGLLVGAELVPRSALKLALVRHERGGTYVELRGERSIDVEVANNVEADALVSALGLDAASTTVDIPVDVAPRLLAPALLTFLVFAVGALAFLNTHFAWIPFACAMALMFGLIVLGRSTLRIGADGILVRRLWGASRFTSHDAIVSVDMAGPAVVVRETNGVETRMTTRGPRAGLEDQAQAIARRIVQARQAHRASGDGPELTVALDRGSRSIREWIIELRKVGAGAASTFRTIGVAREQLIAIVESTTAVAKDRVAAITALRTSLQPDEATRVRVAVERIAEPQVREHMVRVLDARDDEELECELEAFTKDERAP